MHRWGVEAYLFSFFDLRSIQGWMMNATLRPLYTCERPSTHYTGNWVGPRDFLDRHEKSHPYWILNHELSSA
jgi:hypothetical protein